MKSRQELLTLPNVLSMYRLLAFPILLWLIFTDQEMSFAWLLCFNLITDILDGFIARRFNQETDIGAKLDSLADIGTYISAFAGLFVFKWMEIEPHKGLLLSFLILYVLFHLVALVKFKTFPSFHLYSFKITGYLQGIFFATLFLHDFVLWLYALALGWGILACLEELLLLVLMKKPISNVKGLYWYLKRNDAD